MYPRGESNPNRQNRNLKFYPLNYGGIDRILSCKGKHLFLKYHQNPMKFPSGLFEDQTIIRQMYVWREFLLQFGMWREQVGNMSDV